jgi:hypothetical protein
VPRDLGTEVIAPVVQPQQSSQGRLEMLSRRRAILPQLSAGILVRLQRVFQSDFHLFERSEQVAGFVLNHVHVTVPQNMAPVQGAYSMRVPDGPENSRE